MSQLRRTPFKRPQYIRAPRIPVRPLSDCRGVVRQVGDEVRACPKDSRDLAPGDEARLWAHVRGLPCARCWREGYTEVSHSNQIIDGKGKAIKAYPWRVAALCHTCHAIIDSGHNMTKVERREAWNDAHRWTLGQLFERGLVRPV